MMHAAGKRRREIIDLADGASESTAKKRNGDSLFGDENKKVGLAPKTTSGLRGNQDSTGAARPALGFQVLNADPGRWLAQLAYLDKKVPLTCLDKKSSHGNFIAVRAKEEATLTYDRLAQNSAETQRLNVASLEIGEQAAAEANPRQQSTYHQHLQHLQQNLQQSPQLSNPLPNPLPSLLPYSLPNQLLDPCDRKTQLEEFQLLQQLQYYRMPPPKQPKQPMQSHVDLQLNIEPILIQQQAAFVAGCSVSSFSPRNGEEEERPLPLLRKRPSSGYYGVTTNRNRWHAQITTGGKQHNLGTFGTREEAALAYDRSARKCIERKLLNFATLELAEQAVIEAKAIYRTSQSNRQRPASGFYGVRASGKGWKAKIAINKRIHYLGRFDLKEEAALAYDRVAVQSREPRALNYDSALAGEQAVLLARGQREKETLEREEMWREQLRQQQLQIQQMQQQLFQQQPFPQQRFPQLPHTHYSPIIIDISQQHEPQQTIAPAVLKGLEKTDISGRNKPKDANEQESTRLLIDQLQKLQQLQELNEEGEKEPERPLQPLDQLERQLQELRKQQQQQQLLNEQCEHDRIQKRSQQHNQCSAPVAPAPALAPPALYKHHLDCQRPSTSMTTDHEEIPENIFEFGMAQGFGTGVQQLVAQRS
jgi:hypothetical protein